MIKTIKQRLLSIVWLYLSRNDHKVLKVLATGPKTAKEICAALKCGFDFTYVALHRLQKTGEVERHRVIEIDGPRFYYSWKRVNESTTA